MPNEHPKTASGIRLHISTPEALLMQAEGALKKAAGKVEDGVEQLKGNTMPPHACIQGV